MRTSEYLSKKQISELKLTGNILKACHKLDTHKFIKSDAKNKQAFFKTMSFNKNEIKLSDLDIDDMIKKNILQYNKIDNTLILTFKGVVILKYGIENINESINMLLNDLNAVFFESLIKSAETPLNSVEKAVLITYIGLCALSENYAIIVNDENEEYIKKSVDCAVEFLKYLGQEYEDKSLENLWTHEVIGESKIRSEFRRLEKLPKHTDLLFKMHRTKGQYIDILNDRNKIDDRKTEYLLKNIFNKRVLSYGEKKELIKTLDSIQKYGFKIFKESSPFDILEIRKDIKHIIESKI